LVFGFPFFFSKKKKKKIARQRFEQEKKCWEIVCVAGHASPQEVDM
jgi:hypothetical protein